MLTAVSLFAGIGGFDLALARAGIDVVAAVEIDAAARGVLSDRFPATTLFADIREVTGDDLRAAGFVPERGILAGGWPCQDLSVAGARGGLGEGTRSGLFWELARLVADLRPAWLILENVPGLLSAVCPDPASPSPEPDGETDTVGLVLADEDGRLTRGRGACPGGCFPAHGGAMGLVLGALADLGYGFAYRVLDAQHFGVPQRRRRVIIVGRAGGDARGPVEVLLEPEGRPGDPATRGQTRQTTAGCAPRRADDARRGRVVVNSLTRSSVGGAGGADDNTAQAGHLIAAALTAREAKGPDSDATTTLVPVAFDLAQITSRENRVNPRPGDPAVPLCATGMTHVASLAVAGDPAFTVRTPGGGSSYPMVATAAVRRLTPLECERLQGFPDNWTLTSNGTPQADAARYRQCGNAVAVPVIEWVADRVLAVAAAEVSVTNAGAA